MKTKEAIKKYLRHYVTEKYGVVVEDVIEWAPWVWRIQLNEEKCIAAKYQPLAQKTRDLSCDVLVVEREVLGFLVDKGCLVPRWLGCDKKTGFVFYEWVGDETLDDYAQGDFLKARKITPNVIESFKSIDNKLNSVSAQFESRVIMHGGKSDLLSVWEIVTERAKWGAHALCCHLGIANPNKKILAGLHDVCIDLSRREPRLGCSDFNARNIVVSNNRTPYFIEFAKLNWDWTERRLVQYTTSMGSRVEKGSMRVLLCRNNLKDISNVASIDAHQIVFLLNGAAALCLVFDKQKRSLSKYFQRAQFQSLRGRLFAFAKALSEPLSLETKLCEIRSVFNIERKDS